MIEPIFSYKNSNPHSPHVLKSEGALYYRLKFFKDLAIRQPGNRPLYFIFTIFFLQFAAIDCEKYDLWPIRLGSKWGKKHFFKVKYYWKKDKLFLFKFDAHGWQNGWVKVGVRKYGWTLHLPGHLHLMIGKQR